MSGANAAGHEAFSVRDWFGLMAGIAWGLLLGGFSNSGNMDWVWLVIFLGPPVTLLISPNRPILSWQIPIVAAAASNALMHGDPQDTPSLTCLDAAVSWMICSLFSSPWAFIFHHRARRAKQSGAVKQVAVPYAGLVVLVFLACGLTILGVALTLFSSNGPDAANRALPFYGFLMATAGVGLSAVSFRVARNLGVNKPITDMLQLALLFPALFGVVDLLVITYDAVKSTPAARSSFPSQLWCTFAGLEALAILIWLTRSYRREKARPS